MKIRLHNTATRRKEDFVPLDPENVRMYVCGPTVYDRAHIGNARPVVVFDVLYRLLGHVYGPEHVTYVRNITDVEDKIIARAAERGEEIGELTARTTEWFHEDMAALGVDYRGDPQFHEPKATDYVPQMVAMIEQLIQRGHAYEAEGHVLFDVKSYGEYGALSGRSTDDMIAGARVEVAPYKRDPMDFVLWKPSTGDQPGWESPWGKGRPGWHIECSAMSHALLGESFDIHGGGADLTFPHHENEVAQSKCAHPGSGFARYWLHNGMIRVEGQKMAKSLGNFTTVKDLLDRKISGSVIRFVLLSTHYTEPLDWTLKAVDEARKTLTRWGDIVGNEPASTVPLEVIDALADDLNTPQVIAVLHKLAKEGRSGELRAATQFLRLGLIFEVKMELAVFKSKFFDVNVTVNESGEVSAIAENDMDEKGNGFSPKQEKLIESLLHERQLARKNRDFKRADKIRNDLSEAGVEIMDTSNGPVAKKKLDFDSVKLESLS